MITTTAPKSWQALQDEVARILLECGFQAEVSKIVSTPRGKVEIDVYAEENVAGRTYRIVCECKRWRARVPQTVIHSFRTVVAETGANAGYIISRSGYQRGALAASEMTNVRLVTWEEFQSEFEPLWLEKFFSPALTKLLDPLLTYTEPLIPPWVEKLSPQDRKDFFALKERYLPFGLVVMEFSPYVRALGLTKRPFRPLPLRGWVPDPPGPEKIPTSIMDATGYRDFFDLAVEYGTKAIAEFRVFRDRAKALDAE